MEGRALDQAAIRQNRNSGKKGQMNVLRIEQFKPTKPKLKAVALDKRINTHFCGISPVPRGGARSALHPTPRTLHPSLYALHPTPHTLHPTPYTPHPTPYSLHLRPTPSTCSAWRGALLSRPSESNANFSARATHRDKSRKYTVSK